MATSTLRLVEWSTSVYSRKPWAPLGGQTDHFCYQEHYEAEDRVVLHFLLFANYSARLARQFRAENQSFCLGKIAKSLFCYSLLSFQLVTLCILGASSCTKEGTLSCSHTVRAVSTENEQDRPDSALLILYLNCTTFPIWDGQICKSGNYTDNHQTL